MGSARFFSSLKVALLVFPIVISLGTPLGVAQRQPVAEPLITRPVDDSSLVPLHGNVHPLAQARFDRGQAPVSMDARRTVLVLKRTPQRQRMLEQYLASLEDKNSPNFGHFLTPEQFGQQFGPAPEDVTQIVTWLSGQGFSVAKVAKSNMAIEFSGSVSQIETAFHTQIHRFVINGQEHFANVSDPMIPSALATVVAGVSPLHDFFPRPQIVRGPGGKWSVAEKRFVPDLTLNSSSGTQYLFVGPRDAATIYDAPTSLNTRLKSNQATYDGTGITVGIVTDEGVNVFNVADYRSLFALPATTFSIVTDGDPLSGDADSTESTLDGEVVSAVAPDAKLVYYQAADTSFQSGVMLAILRALDDNAINILNVSYGGCELAQGAAGNQEILNAWEQAAAQGIAVTVASGDSGAAGCDNPNSEMVATQGFGVNGLASTPYTVAVGGTDFDVLANSFSQYASSTNGPGYVSALGYIPENSWNDSTKSNGASGNNQAEVDSKGNTNIVAGGGGASSASVYDASGKVTGGYAKPLWQRQYETSAGMAPDKARDVPDLSLFAANGLYRAVWATCGNNDCSGADPTISGIGGTSASAPAFAGVLALINQKIGANQRLGQPNWVLYDLAKSHPEAFHHIQGGNISVVCKEATPNCAANGFLSGYDVAGSYNLATGLGSIDISSLVNNWTSVGRTQTTTSLTLSPTLFQHGSTATIGITVNPAAATGNVALSTDATARTGASSNVQLSFPLSAGQATGSWAGLPGGTYDVYANYGGDGSYSGSVSTPTQITVTPEDSILQLSISAANASGKLTNIAGATVTYGTYISVDAQPIGKLQAGSIHPIKNATGAVGFVDSNPSAVQGGGNLDASGNAELNEHYYFPAGQHSITANYSGDASYNPSTSATVTFTVQKAPTKILLTTNENSINGDSLTLTGAVTPIVPDYYAPIDHGTITFTDTTSGAVLGTVSGLNGARDPSTGVLSSTGFINVQVNQFVPGANSIVATYSGGRNFADSGRSAPVVVTCTAGCGNGTGQYLGVGIGNVSPPTFLISAGDTATASVGVGPGGGFTGAVNLTCTVAGTVNSDINIPQCSFSPATVTIADTSGVGSTLTVTTTAPGKTSAAITGSRSWFTSRGGLILACMVLLGFPARRRSFALLRVVLCGVVLGGMLACGGGSTQKGTPPGGGSVNPGTSLDRYTITIHATDVATGKLTAENYFKLTVE